MGGFQCALTCLEQVMERTRVAGFVFVQAAQSARLLNTQAFGGAFYESYKTHDLYLYYFYVFTQ
ncbi:hypothetical protein D3C80_2063790 [compost metagenome]